MARTTDAIKVLLLFITTVKTLETHSEDQNNNYLISFKATDIFPVTIIMDLNSQLDFNYSYPESNNSKITGVPEKCIVSSLSDDSKASIFGSDTFKLEEVSKSGNLSVEIIGKLPGRVTLYLDIFKNCNTNTATFNQQGNSLKRFSFKLMIEKENEVIDNIFTAVVICLVIVANIGMGCKVSLSCVGLEKLALI